MQLTASKLPSSRFTCKIIYCSWHTAMAVTRFAAYKVRDVPNLNNTMCTHLHRHTLIYTTLEQYVLRAL